MAIQIDFAVAVGFFLVLFAFLVSHTTQYYASVKETAELAVVRSEALSLLEAANREPVPANWSSAPLKLGLRSYAFRFFVPVNNTQAFWLNQSRPVSALESELVTVNMTDVFGPMDINSVSIEDNGTLLPYQLDGTNVTFAVNVSANQTKWITVTFDDDSNFTSRSQVVSGTNNLSERILAPERFPLIPFRLAQQLNASDYGTVRAGADIERQFRIRLLDAANATFVSLGPSPPSGTVISLEQPAVYENGTAAMQRGKMRVEVW